LQTIGDDGTEGQITSRILDEQSTLPRKILQNDRNMYTEQVSMRESTFDNLDNYKDNIVEQNNFVRPLKINF